MPRAGLSSTIVVAEGARLLDEVGLSGFTLAVLAGRLGVRAPSLYKHVDGLPSLQRSIMLRAKHDLAGVLAEAGVGRARDAAVRAMAHAYRAWARAHPGQYPMTQRAPVPGDPEDLAASQAVLAPILQVLGGYELTGDDAVDAIRFLRSALHGFVILEATGAFEQPVDVEQSYSRLVTSVITAYAGWRTP